MTTERLGHIDRQQFFSLSSVIHTFLDGSDQNTTPTIPSYVVQGLVLLKQRSIFYD